MATLAGRTWACRYLEREKAVFKETGAQPDLAGHDYIIERQLKPEARRDIVALLKELEVKPTSMIDISDGLASEAMHLARSRAIGVSISRRKTTDRPDDLSHGTRLRPGPEHLCLERRARITNCYSPCAIAITRRSRATRA